MTFFFARVRQARGPSAPLDPGGWRSVEGGPWHRHKSALVIVGGARSVATAMNMQICVPAGRTLDHRAATKPGAVDPAAHTSGIYIMN